MAYARTAANADKRNSFGSPDCASERLRARRSAMSVYRRDRCPDGYTPFCHSYTNPATSESGKGLIYLIDMEGNPVHE